MKAALYIDKRQEDYSHNYDAVYCTLSRELKEKLIGEAQQTSQIFDIKMRIESLLRWYKYNFVRLRYPFQNYENMAEEEYRQYSNLYKELGCPDGEAEFEYYPEELRRLFIALQNYVAKSC